MKCKHSTCVACLQRQAFYDYLPAHMNGVALIILVSSINAVCYNMVRECAGGKRGFEKLACGTLCPPACSTRALPPPCAATG